LAKDAQGRVENNSRKPKNLVRKISIVTPKKVQFTLSRGRKKKRDEVADDEDDDAVSTSVSQDQVTACTKELYPNTQYI
jgi:hypothetical protein